MARRGAGLFLVGAGWRHGRESAEFDGDGVRNYTLKILLFMCVWCKTLVSTHESKLPENGSLDRVGKMRSSSGYLGDK